MTFACAIFIRMPFAESDGYGGLILSRIGFVLICPSRDVTDALLNCVDATLISTHTPLAGRDACVDWLAFTITISTHTPLAGRDLLTPHFFQLCFYFYSHAPRGT